MTVSLPVQAGPGLFRRLTAVVWPRRRTGMVPRAPEPKLDELSLAEIMRLMRRCYI